MQKNAPVLSLLWLHCWSLFCLWGFILSAQAAALSESFELPTENPEIQLRAQLDLPESHSEPVPLVLMVPGTGPYDRDLDFGRSGTPADLIYKDLAVGLNVRGIASLRFDKRGIYCNRYSQVQRQCWKSSEMLSYNAETLREDLKRLFAWAQQDPRVDRRRIAILAHSEGGYHVAALVGQNQIQPHSLYFWSVPLQSPSELLRWQMSDRIVAALYQYDANADGVLSNDEFRDQPPLFQILAVKRYLHPQGAWKAQELATALTQGHALFVKSLEQRKTAELIENNSLLWWQWFSRSEEQPLNLLQNYARPLYLYWGAADAQMPIAKQFDVLNEVLPTLQSHPVLTVFPRLGHGLSANHPILGPIDLPARQHILAQIEAELKP